MGQAPANQRLRRPKLLIVGGGLRKVIDKRPPVGNGRAISVLCSRERASVVVLDVSREAADATAAQIRAYLLSATVEAYKVNVKDPTVVCEAAEDAWAKLGRLDGVVLV